MPQGGVIQRKIAVLILFACIFYRGHSQSSASTSFRLMFYNVENLFDIHDDTLKNDNDFLPRGVMRWNYTRYRNKINALYKTIVSAGGWSPPAVVSLCEIENRKVLEDLVSGTYLSKYDYMILHEESPDMRGIDVCMIYRKDLVQLIEYKYWIPSGINGKDFTSRSILYTELLIGNDTLHIIVNHWPSRRGGVLAGEELRMRIAALIREKADSIMSRCTGGARIIIMGDFNSRPDDREMGVLMKNRHKERSLFNLSASYAGKGLGTYRYRGIWEMIDQVIVSDKLLTCRQGLCTDKTSFKIHSPDFLLTRDPFYPGLMPFSTYRGYRYQGGFSDHLPVLLDLNLR